MERGGGYTFSPKKCNWDLRASRLVVEISPGSCSGVIGFVVVVKPGWAWMQKKEQQQLNYSNIHLRRNCGPYNPCWWEKIEKWKCACPRFSLNLFHFKLRVIMPPKTLFKPSSFLLFLLSFWGLPFSSHFSLYSLSLSHCSISHPAKFPARNERRQVVADWKGKLLSYGPHFLCLEIVLLEILLCLLYTSPSPRD